MTFGGAEFGTLYALLKGQNHPQDFGFGGPSYFCRYFSSELTLNTGFPLFCPKLPDMIPEKKIEAINKLVWPHISDKLVTDQ